MKRSDACGKQKIALPTHLVLCCGPPYANLDVLLSLLMSSEAGNNETTVRPSSDETSVASESSERVLYKGEVYFQFLFEATSDAIFIGAPDGTYLDVNPAAAKMLGLTRADLVGQPAIKFIHPDWLDVAKQLRTQIREDKSWSGILPMLRADGAVVWAEYRSHSDGKIVIGIARDVTEQRQAQEALRQSEEKLRLAIEGAGLGMWSVEFPTYQITTTELNNHFFGLASDDLSPTREQMFALLHPEDIQGVIKKFRECVESGGLFDVQFRIIRADGVIRWLSSQGRTYRDAEGRLVRFIGVTTDVTDRKTSEDARREIERRLRLITDHAPVLLAYCGADLTFRFVNRAYAERLGLHPREVIGKSIPEILGEEAYASIRPYVEAALRGERIEYELEVPYRNMEPQYMWVAYEPEFNQEGQVLGYVAAIVNITTRKRAEEALREANRRKDEFLAMLSHELRNPLAPLQNAAALLRQLELTDERLQSACQVINRQVIQMTRIMDDLLDVSRVTQNKITLQKAPVELSQVIFRAIEISQPLILARKHELKVELVEGLLLDGDVTRLAQIFSNLLNNAAKYTEEAGTISITVEAAEQAVAIRIRDTGMGISKELLPYVFDLFTQSDRSLDRSEGGLGIGLTMVQKLTELHGGKVEVFSEGAGKGSEFVVYLPLLVTSQKNLPLSPPVQEDVPASLRVLVVDDNYDSAESMAMLIHLMGHETQIASDGDAALAAVRSFHPDAVLLDIGLPGMSGFDVARRLRQIPGAEHILLIAMTGYGQARDFQLSREAGFDHHLVKPIDDDVVEELLKKKKGAFSGEPKTPNTQE